MASTRSKRKSCAEACEQSETKQPKLELSPEDVEQLANVKKLVRVLEEDWTCPITYKLFADPVEAEDGMVYERWAIEQHLLKSLTSLSKSPVTNEVMGKRIRPAPWMVNAITKMIESGLVDKEMANEWNADRSNLVSAEGLRAKAAAGDAAAMARLGFSYRDGTRGIPKNPVVAFEWFLKSANLKYASAAHACGVAYITGSGVKRCIVRGIVYITQAANWGSEHSCGVLAWANASGQWGFDHNAGDTTLWYREMQKANCRDSNDIYRDRAKAWLAMHP